MRSRARACLLAPAAFVIPITCLLSLWIWCSFSKFSGHRKNLTRPRTMRAYIYLRVILLFLCTSLSLSLLVLPLHRSFHCLRVAPSSSRLSSFKHRARCSTLPAEDLYNAQVCSRPSINFLWDTLALFWIG